MAEQEKSTSEQIRNAVAWKLQKISTNPAEGEVKAQLARLRRGIGKKPGNTPELWAELFEDLPEDLMGKRQEPSEAEWALYTALTLYALHQQSKKIQEENMNKQDQKLGLAVAELAKAKETKSKEAEKAIRRRFNAMATAADITELAWHLRGMIQLLRGESIPLDYPQLAVDLYWYQSVDRQASVRLKWGRDYYQQYNRLTKSGKEEKNGN